MQRSGSGAHTQRNTLTIEMVSEHLQVFDLANKDFKTVFKNVPMTKENV